MTLRRELACATTDSHADNYPRRLTLLPDFRLSRVTSTDRAAGSGQPNRRPECLQECLSDFGQTLRVLLPGKGPRVIRIPLPPLRVTARLWGCSSCCARPSVSPPHLAPPLPSPSLDSSANKARAPRSSCTRVCRGPGRPSLGRGSRVTRTRRRRPNDGNQGSTCRIHRRTPQPTLTRI